MNIEKTGAGFLKIVSMFHHSRDKNDQTDLVIVLYFCLSNGIS